MLKSGRAVLYPVYKGSYERGGGTEVEVNTASAWRGRVILLAKDASRAIDYAQTRPELDRNKLAYYGYSEGANMGAIIASLDPPIKVCVLALGGLDFACPLPENDPVNFLPRVKQPALMLNGRYDSYYPVELCQEPFFRLLGSAKNQKKHLIYDSGSHDPTLRAHQGNAGLAGSVSGASDVSRLLSLPVHLPPRSSTTGSI